MKNFILRFLGSYILYTGIIAIWFLFLNDNYAGFYGKEGAFRWGVLLIYPFLSLVGSIMGYFSIGYISEKVRNLVLFLMILIFSGNTIINANQSSMAKNTLVGIFYYLSVLGIPQFINPNFNFIKHRLDNDKEYFCYYIIFLVCGYGLLIYYLFFFKGFNFII